MNDADTILKAQVLKKEGFTPHTDAGCHVLHDLPFLISHSNPFSCSSSIANSLFKLE